MATPSKFDKDVKVFTCTALTRSQPTCNGCSLGFQHTATPSGTGLVKLRMMPLDSRGGTTQGVRISKKSLDEKYAKEDPPPFSLEA